MRRLNIKIIILNEQEIPFIIIILNKLPLRSRVISAEVLVGNMGRRAAAPFSGGRVLVISVSPHMKVHDPLN